MKRLDCVTKELKAQRCDWGIDTNSDDSANKQNSPVVRKRQRENEDEKEDTRESLSSHEEKEKNPSQSKQKKQTKRRRRSKGRGKQNFLNELYQLPKK